LTLSREPAPRLEQLSPAGLDETRRAVPNARTSSPREAMKRRRVWWAAAVLGMAGIILVALLWPRGEAPPIELPATTQVLAEEFFPETTEWEGIPVDETHARGRASSPRCSSTC